MFPVHIGLGVAVAVAVGLAPMVILIDVVAMHPCELVTVRLYIPALAAVILVMEGLEAVDLKPDGPVHEYKLPPEEDRFNVPPIQTGLLAEIVGT